MQIIQQNEDDDRRRKDAQQREILEKQIIELNDDLQTLENEKNDLNEQVDQLKEQLQSKDRQIQSIQVFHSLLHSFIHSKSILCLLEFRHHSWLALRALLLPRHSHSFSVTSNLRTSARTRGSSPPLRRPIP